MRIIFAFNGFGTGGAERVATNLANYLSQDNDIAIVCTTDNGINPYETNNKVKVFPGIDKRASTLRKMITACRTIDEWKPDIIVSFLIRINTMVLLSPRLQKYKILISERNDPTAIKSKVWRILRRISTIRADGMVYQTKAAMEFYRWYKGPKRVICNPVKAPLIPSDITKRAKRVIMLSRLESQKNVSMAIDAFIESGIIEKDYELYIYGDGSQKEKLAKKINRSGYGEKIHLMGRTIQAFNELNNSRFFLLSSNYEGMPNALLEAMSMGVIAISTDCPIGGPRSIIQNEKNGFLVSLNDSKAMGECLNRLVGNERIVKQISLQAIQSCEILQPDKIHKQWLDFINQICNT